MKGEVRLSSLLVAGVFLLVSVFAGNSFAASVKIGVINMQKVLTSSDAGKQAQKDLENKMKEFKKKFKADEDALIALQKEIEKKSSVWSEEKKQEKLIELQKSRRDLNTKQEDANLELKQLREKRLAPILKNLKKVVDEVSKKGKYTLVLPNTAVLYMDDSIDMTDTVTKALNKASKK